jgi:hypothetical protein
MKTMIKWKGLPGIFISNRKKGERARQQRDRERACERGSVLRGEGDGIGNKIDC